MPSLVYLNGNYMDFSEARVSVEDRGFQFGEGVYEVVRCYRGGPFRLGQHLKRLAASAQAIRLNLPHTVEKLGSIAEQLLQKSGLQEASLYIQVTSGAAPRAHYLPVDPEPTLVMTVRDIGPLPDRAAGVTVITVPDDRWLHCNVKSTNLLPNTLAKRRARESGAFEAIFVGPEAAVHEGSSSNIFAVSQKALMTPDLSHNILPGITRAIVLETARDLGYRVEERKITLEELYRAEEVFITSTVMELIPVLEVDRSKIGTGMPGPVWRELYQAYKQRVEEEIN